MSTIMSNSKDRILVRLEKNLSDRVRQFAKEETRSINSFIVNALKVYISWKDEY